MRRAPLLLTLACAAPAEDHEAPAQEARRSAFSTSLDTSPRAQAEARDAFTHERFGEVLPRLMREEGVQLWALFAREYNEDPALATMLPASWRNARRTTMLLCFAGREGVERVAVSRYPVGSSSHRRGTRRPFPIRGRPSVRSCKSACRARIGLNVSHDRRTLTA